MIHLSLQNWSNFNQPTLNYIQPKPRLEFAKFAKYTSAFAGFYGCPNSPAAAFPNSPPETAPQSRAGPRRSAQKSFKPARPACSVHSRRSRACLPPRRCVSPPTTSGRGGVDRGGGVWGGLGSPGRWCSSRRNA